MTDLTGVKMAETTNGFLFVQVASSCLHTADHLHVSVIFQGIISR